MKSRVSGGWFPALTAVSGSVQVLCSQAVLHLSPSLPLSKGEVQGSLAPQLRDCWDLHTGSLSSPKGSGPRGIQGKQALPH